MTTQTAEFFGRYAHDFDAIYGVRNAFHNRLVNQFLRKSMFLRYEKTLAGCDPIEGRSVLDVGSGSGHFSIALAARGAGRVLGLDFAESMIEMSRAKAAAAGVEDRCEFRIGDFTTEQFNEQFDYTVVCGVMDYIAEPLPFVQKVVSLTRSKAFFSFPRAGGLLAWQRQVRYRSRCPLYLYTMNQIREMMAEATDGAVTIERISRDYFVTVRK